MIFARGIFPFQAHPLICLLEPLVKRPVDLSLEQVEFDFVFAGKLSTNFVMSLTSFTMRVSSRRNRPTYLFSHTDHGDGFMTCTPSKLKKLGLRQGQLEESTNTGQNGAMILSKLPSTAEKLEIHTMVLEMHTASIFASEGKFQNKEVLQPVYLLRGKLDQWVLLKDRKV